MNHDRVELFREKLDRFIISDYHGLKSPGLTCYLNSVLQVLFMTEDFRDAVKRSKDPTTIDPHLGKLFANLQKRMARTHNITRTLRITNVLEQRDAAEYFEKILCLTSSEAAKVFKGELNHKTRCLECKETNDSRSFFWMLPLVVEDKRHQTYSVEKGLKAFFKREKVCRDNKMFCNRCKKKQDADFGCEITQNPKILTLLLKRFSFEYKRWCYVKLHHEVDIPLTLDMKKCTYDLYALVNHYGDLTGGHYTAQIKSFETRVWYHFNDDIVERVRQPLFGSGDKSLRSCTAYLLMYKLRGNPEKNDEGDQEAYSAQMSDVEAQGRHDDAEGGEALDEICNGAESMEDLNGDIFKKKKLTNFSREMKKTHNRRAESMRPRKEIQTDSGADRDCYKPALRAQEPHFAKLRKDGGESRKPNRQHFETNSEEHTRHLNIRGDPTEHWRTHHVDGVLEPNRESQTKRQNSIVAKTGFKTQI